MSQAVEEYKETMRDMCERLRVRIVVWSCVAIWAGCCFSATLSAGLQMKNG